MYTKTSATLSLRIDNISSVQHVPPRVCRYPRILVIAIIQIHDSEYALCSLVYPSSATVLLIDRIGLVSLFLSTFNTSIGNGFLAAWIWAKAILVSSRSRCTLPCFVIRPSASLRHLSICLGMEFGPRFGAGWMLTLTRS